MINFRCESCDGKPEFSDLGIFKGHLHEVHGLNTEGIRGRKELLMHINAGKTHTSSYRWTLDAGVVFVQTTVFEKGQRKR